MILALRPCGFNGFDLMGIVYCFVYVPTRQLVNWDEKN